jgi:hypothetical protein
MSAKIIHLKNVKRGLVRCPESGVVFPQLYRLTGNWPELDEDGQPYEDTIANDNGPTPIKEKRAPSYTLDMETEYEEISDPHWTPISYLDPAIDKGWVIIRHHYTRESMYAYMDAMFDTETYESPLDRWQTFETDIGFFSVLRRPATTGAPDHVVIWITKVMDPTDGTQTDWFKVTGPDGQDMDIDALDPPNYRSDTSSIWGTNERH